MRRDSDDLFHNIALNYRYITPPDLEHLFTLYHSHKSVSTPILQVRRTLVGTERKAISGPETAVHS